MLELKVRVIAKQRYLARIPFKDPSTRLLRVHGYRKEKSPKYLDGVVLVKRATLLHTLNGPGEVRNRDNEEAACC